MVSKLKYVGQPTGATVRELLEMIDPVLVELLLGEQTEYQIVDGELSFKNSDQVCEAIRTAAIRIVNNRP